MKHQYHFENLNVWREATQTKTLIGDIDRIVQILNADIAAEEEQAGIFDCSRPEYPVLARALAARRDNLKETIAALEQRLELTRALDSGAQVKLNQQILSRNNVGGLRNGSGHQAV